MELQFSEAEKRFVLAEAIKKSSISIDKLFSVLAEYNVMPDWEHMLLPTGRDLSQCKNAFDSLRHGQPSQLPASQPQPQPQPQPQSFLSPALPSSSNKRSSMNIIPGPDTKRRKSGTETPTIARDILPKPSNGSPMSMTTSSPATVSQKKRGRPSKADVERKQREAIERGDIIPPAPVAAPPAGQQGQEEVRSGNFAPIMIAPAPAPARSPPAPITPAHVLSPQLGLEQGPTQPPVTMSGDPSGKKRKPRQPPKPKVQKPGESQFSIHSQLAPSGEGENQFTSASTEIAPAGTIAAPVEAVKPQSSIASVISQDPAPETQLKPDTK